MLTCGYEFGQRQLEWSPDSTSQLPLSHLSASATTASKPLRILMVRGSSPDLLSSCSTLLALCLLRSAYRTSIHII